MWVYINSEPGLYTVGFYSPDGKWHADSDWDSRDEARQRVTLPEWRKRGVISMDWDRFCEGARSAALRYRPSDAEDIVQDAVVRILRRPAVTYSNVAGLGYVVAKRLALSQHRHCRPQVALDDLGDLEEPHDGDDREWAIGAARYLAERVGIDKLLWLLRYYDGARHSSTDKVRAHRLRRRCIELLREEC